MNLRYVLYAERKEMFKLFKRKKKPYKTHKCTLGYRFDDCLSFVMEGACPDIEAIRKSIMWYNYCPECGRKLK